MQKFVIDPKIFEIYQDLKIAVLVAKNLGQSKHSENYFINLINEAVPYATTHLPNEQLSDNEVIAKWRAAYKKFPTDKGNKSSIEALLKRAKNQGKLPNLSPLVDIYNYISVKYGVPCGSEDLDKIDGAIQFTQANGNEAFITYGSDKSEPPYQGEVLYKDNLGAICRSFNWREAVRTMITDETKNAIFFIEEVSDKESDKTNIMNAIEELNQKIADNFNSNNQVFLVDKNNNSIEF
ncbi:B3/B4 domain-containing protein [Mycoplasmopsis iners]|uniref:B3/B4 domain-containing protein n=1 Tax=Mycoplasmopsis iners TaxID=76630 RepID=UPI0004981F94|nr:phenylalanine--tRNA ligase beta subunit-related protein [Mycoplasmopsis iners]